VTAVSVIVYESFARCHLRGVMKLLEIEGWGSYLEDAERTFRAFTAPGVVTMVAAEAGEVRGFAQILTDGEIRAYLTDIVVAASFRKQGIGKRLIEEGFARANARYLDLLSTEDAETFYASFPGFRRLPGIRIYPNRRA
jgi:ribosomal protein S18 acetylase RimI-like enzyme